MGDARCNGSAPANYSAVMSDTVRGDVHELTLRLPRRAPTVGLWVDAAAVRRVVVAGRDITVHREWGPWSFAFPFHETHAGGVSVRLDLNGPSKPATLLVVDRSDSLDPAPALLTSPTERVLPPPPQLVVTRAVAIRRKDEYRLDGRCGHATGLSARASCAPRTPRRTP